MDDVRQGLADGAGIALGYFTISIAFGLYCSRAGVTPLVAALMSMTNLSSSGQFAAISLLATGGSLIEIALTVALVNLRYVLMSVSLSQRLPGVGRPGRALLAWGVTDEIYAVAMSRSVISFSYYAALMALPIFGWTAGTVVGTLVGEVLPPPIQSAAGILLYGMFIAVVVPPSRDNLRILGVVALAATVSIGLWWVPVAVGWKVIVATCLAAGVGATIWPVAQP